MKIIIGDLIKLAQNKQFDVIVHQCNCFHNFGAGIALQIRKHYPEAFEADKKTMFGHMSKMGSISYATIGNLIVVNGYSQFGCGTDQIRTEYDAVREVFRKVKLYFSGGHEQMTRIGYPLYGAGLAGGDWNIISNIIDEELEGEDHTLVRWDKK